MSRDEWLKERRAFWLKEKAITHELDALRAERRALPWVKIEKRYEFDGPGGQCTLLDLFGAQTQLAVYHFMLSPDSDHVCKGCSFLSDHTDAARRHFSAADLAFAAISRAPIERIEFAKNKLGWTFPWVSSGNSDFNYDFGVSFRPEDIKAGRATFNYGGETIEHLESQDRMGVSIFIRNDAGAIFHTYSAFARGIENLMGAFMWEDLIPHGRADMDDGESRI